MGEWGGGGGGVAPHSVTQRKPGAVDQGGETSPTVPCSLLLAAPPPLLLWQGLLWNSGLGQKSLLQTPEGLRGGSGNLAAALQVWQTQAFSSALRSAKPKMCLARKKTLL